MATPETSDDSLGTEDNVNKALAGLESSAQTDNTNIDARAITSESPQERISQAAAKAGEVLAEIGYDRV